MIRKANIDDVKRIMTIIENAVADMDSKKIYQWDESYPNEEVIKQDLKNEVLYVYEDNENVKGIIVLSEDYDKEYESIAWKLNSGTHLVVHRLCVDPKMQGQGIARQLMNFAEEYAKNFKYESIRLDAFVNNGRACRIYEKLGYTKLGIVNFRKGKFYCYEKGI